MKVQALPVSRHLVEGLARLQRARAELAASRTALAAVDGVEDVLALVVGLMNQVEDAQRQIRACALTERMFRLNQRHRGALCELCEEPETHGERRGS